MGKWNYTYIFENRSQFSPLTLEGPPYSPLTVEADNAIEAAKLAKDLLPQHIVDFGTPPFGCSADNVDMILLMRTDVAEDQLDENDAMQIMGMLAPTFVDYKTLTEKI